MRSKTKKNRDRDKCECEQLNRYRVPCVLVWLVQVLRDYKLRKLQTIINDTRKPCHVLLVHG